MGEEKQTVNTFFFLSSFPLDPALTLTVQPNAEVVQMDFQRDLGAEREAPECRSLFRVFWQKAAYKVPNDPRCLPNFTGSKLAAEWEAAMIGI